MWTKFIYNEQGTVGTHGKNPASIADLELGDGSRVQIFTY